MNLPTTGAICVHGFAIGHAEQLQRTAPVTAVPASVREDIATRLYAQHRPVRRVRFHSTLSVKRSRVAAILQMITRRGVRNLNAHGNARTGWLGPVNSPREASRNGERVDEMLTNGRFPGIMNYHCKRICRPNGMASARRHEARSGTGVQ